MKTLEITTPQNVTVNYGLSGVWKRVFAFGLDFLLLIVALIVLAIVNSTLITRSLQEYFAYFVIFPVWMFYTLFFENTMNGQTPGKRVMGIRVMRVDGQKCTAEDYLLRWIFRVVDIYFSAGSLAVTLIASSGKRQRLGDILAGTVVVNKAVLSSVTLDSLLHLNALENYELKYPGAEKFGESEVLLIKEVIDRSQKHPNTAHRKALDDMAQKTAQRLRLSEIPADKREFLRRVMRDYIVSTR